MDHVGIYTRDVDVMCGYAHAHRSALAVAAHTMAEVDERNISLRELKDIHDAWGMQVALH